MEGFNEVASTPAAAAPVGENREELSVPSGLKGLRACIVCMLVKTSEQFSDDGCENCRSVFTPDDYPIFTTPYYLGCAAMMKPKESWVARTFGRHRVGF